jgi:hypothetical protein
MSTAATKRIGPPDVVVESCPRELPNGTKLLPCLVIRLVTKSGSDWFSSVAVSPPVDKRVAIVLEAAARVILEQAERDGLVVSWEAAT